jgi:hypothetical protein
MSRAERIRDYLRQNGATTPESGITRTQIRAALGLTKNQSSSGINDLKSAGFLASVGEVRGMRYYVTDKVPMVPMAPDAKREAEKARQIRRRRMAGSLSRAEYLAKFAAKRDAEAAERAQRKAARAAAKQAKQTRAERKKANVAQLERKRNAIRVGKARAALKNEYRFTSTAPVKQQIAPPQSVEEWLAQGGTVERLDAFAVSKPFRAIGFNNREAA